MGKVPALLVEVAFRSIRSDRVIIGNEYFILFAYYCVKVSGKNAAKTGSHNNNIILLQVVGGSFAFLPET